MPGIMSFVIDGVIDWERTPQIFSGTWYEATRTQKPQGFSYTRVLDPDLDLIASFFSSPIQQGASEGASEGAVESSDAPPDYPESSSPAAPKISPLLKPLATQETDKATVWNGTFNVNVGHGRQKAYPDTFIVDLIRDAAEKDPNMWIARGRGKNQVGFYTLTGSYNQETRQLVVERAYDAKPVVMKTSPKPRPSRLPRTDPVLSASAEKVEEPPASIAETAEESAAAGGTSRKSARAMRPNKLFDKTLFANVPLTENGLEMPVSRKRQRSVSSIPADSTHIDDINDISNIISGEPAPTRSVAPAATAAPPQKRARASAPVVPLVPLTEPIDLDESSAIANFRAVLQSQLYGKSDKEAKELESYGMLAPTVRNPFATGWNAARILDDTAGFLAGEIYEGELQHGLPHGFGCCIYRNGLMYEGQWVNGKENGRGAISDGDDMLVYQGDIQDGQINGTGTFYFGNGDKYVGQWKDGLFHGRGMFTSHIGASYDGEWHEGLRHGTGTMLLPDGTQYAGNWRHGQKHGKGELICPSGFRYKGSWTNDIIDGKGEAVYADGSRYEGMFKDGKRDGRGTFFFPDQQQYGGRFVCDDIDASVPGTVLIPKTIKVAEDEWMIPLNLQTDLSKIHLRAGFDKSGQ